MLIALLWLALVAGLIVLGWLVFWAVCAVFMEPIVDFDEIQRLDGQTADSPAHTTVRTDRLRRCLRNQIVRKFALISAIASAIGALVIWTAMLVAE